jgi:hypothetical protein
MALTSGRDGSALHRDAAKKLSQAEKKSEKALKSRDVDHEDGDHIHDIEQHEVRMMKKSKPSGRQTD